MTINFQDIPNDEETKILHEKIITKKGISFLHQFWIWEEIEGDSYIFKTSDVINLNNVSLINFLPKSKRKNSTISQGEDYTFVNFNFHDCFENIF